jgi:hypothetical protein
VLGRDGKRSWRIGLTKRPLSGQWKEYLSRNSQLLLSSITEECLWLTNANSEKSSKSNRIIRFSPVTHTCPSAFLQSPHLLRQTISTRRTSRYQISHTLHGSPHHTTRGITSENTPVDVVTVVQTSGDTGLSNQGDDNLARPRLSITWWCARSRSGRAKNTKGNNALTRFTIVGSAAIRAQGA